jgi:hypothetical protein
LEKVNIAVKVGGVTERKSGATIRFSEDSAIGSTASEGQLVIN